jgi:transcriptional regulator with XRE-family HTH domain
MTPEELKIAREENELSQRALALALGYKTKGSISRLESGERKINPRLERLIKQVIRELSNDKEI